MGHILLAVLVLVCRSGHKLARGVPHRWRLGKPASFELAIVASFPDKEGLVGARWLAAPVSVLLVVISACGGYVAAHAAFVAATSLGSLPVLS